MEYLEEDVDFFEEDETDFILCVSVTFRDLVEFKGFKGLSKLFLSPDTVFLYCDLSFGDLNPSIVLLRSMVNRIFLSFHQYQIDKNV